MNPNRLSLQAVLLTLLLLVMSSTITSALSTQDNPQQERVLEPTLAPEEDFRSSPVMFIENVGQWDEGARFQVWGGPEGTMWLAEDGIWLTVVEQGGGGRRSEVGSQRPFEMPESATQEPRKGVNLKISFPGANPHPAIETFDRLDTTISYFYGNDPEKWRPDVPVWGGVRYVDLWPGVDLEMGSEDGRLVQRFVTEEGEDVSGVGVLVEGEDGATLDQGLLILETEVRDLVLPSPQAEFAYQIGNLDAVGLVNALEVPLGTVDTIDVQTVALPQDNPADLLYSTFLGGSNNEMGLAIAVDGGGRAYVAGETLSTDFPTTPGSFDRTHNGGYDVFAARLNASGTNLEYSTFIGGSGDELYGVAIAVDTLGRAYVTSHTDTSDFPTTPDAYDTSYNGGLDVFVLRLEASGSNLGYSTFLGGNSTEISYSIAIDQDNRAYIAGLSASDNFPTTPNAFSSSLSGDSDAFTVRLNATGSALEYGTYIGGVGYDRAYSITVDAVNRAYVTGFTGSADFPTTPGAYDTSFNGGYFDGFVLRINESGSALDYASYLGGSDDDYGGSITTNHAGEAYVAGSTSSSNFPTTVGTFDTSFNGGSSDSFIVRITSSGSNLRYATFIGGSSADEGGEIRVDGSGNASVAGHTGSANFPVTSNAFSPSINGVTDAFVLRLNADGDALDYGTFLGGANGAQGLAMSMDSVQEVFVTGWTHSSDFPTTVGAFDTSHNGSTDAFVAKLAMGGTATPTPTPTPITNSPTGALGQATCDAITGWAGDKDDPNQPIDVHIYANAP